MFKVTEYAALMFDVLHKQNNTSLSLLVGTTEYLAEDLSPHWICQHGSLAPCQWRHFVC